jgi:uncharacterized protein (TIGR02453 family)
MIKQSYFDFFEELAANNHRDWFLANKKRYENDVKEPFLKLLEEIVASLADSEPDLGLTPVKNMMFRINRDTRFSKNKDPYKNNLGGSITRFGTKDKAYPGHYVQLGIENFIAGGAYWFEEKEMLNRVRHFMAMNAERFSQLLENQDFKSKWIEIKGEKNKRLNDPDLMEAAKSQPLILNTQFYWGIDIKKDMALKPDFVQQLRGYFIAAQPMNQFLLEAMNG